MTVVPGAFTPIADPVVTDFKRNGRGQPMIVPPDGGKPVPYNRPSSFGKKIEDFYNIGQWEKRCVVVGMSRTPSLVARAVAIEADPKAWSKADKDALNLIADEAKTAARANQAADIGTALHRMTERADLGEDLGDLPAPFDADITAYHRGMDEHRVVVIKDCIECRLVCDELKLAGTADRITIHNQTRRVFDLKTGESVELAALGYAVQLAIYSHSVLYDVNTGARTPIDVDQAIALIGHLPAGQGSFDLYEVDIAAGWEAALLAADIDKWRKRRNLMAKVPPTAAINPPVKLPATPAPVDPVALQANLRDRCKTVVAMSTGAADMLRINLGVAGLDLRTPLAADDLNAARDIVEAAEREANAPFNDLPARAS